jgi:hypothetical protein
MCLLREEVSIFIMNQKGKELKNKTYLKRRMKIKKRHKLSGVLSKGNFSHERKSQSDLKTLGTRACQKEGLVKLRVLKLV